jgi:O-antigen/teichoic acid export membrane protein
VLFAFGLLFANIVIALGRTGTLLAVQVVALVLLLPAIVVGIRISGLVGIGVAHIVVIAFVTIPLYVATIKKSSGMELRIVLAAVAPPVVAATIAAVAAWAAALAPDAAPIKLVAGGFVGATVYGVFMAPRLAELAPASLVSWGPIAWLLSHHVRWTERVSRLTGKQAHAADDSSPSDAGSDSGPRL